MTSADFGDKDAPVTSRVVMVIPDAPLRVDVNPLAGAVTTDDRLAGASPADKAALEYGLRLGEEILGLGPCRRLGRRPTVRDGVAGRAGTQHHEGRYQGGPAGRRGIPSCQPLASPRALADCAVPRALWRLQLGPGRPARCRRCSSLTSCTPHRRSVWCR